MSALENMREWFMVYKGPSKLIKTKYVEFVGFDNDVKVETPLVDLILFQAKVAGQKISKKSAVTAVDGITSTLGVDFSQVLSRSLVRRFVDDQRNQENADFTKGVTVPKAIAKVAEGALESGTKSDLTTAQSFLTLSGYSESSLYADVTKALEGESDTDTEQVSD